MADISDLKQSEVVRIVGSDEQFAADVIEEGGQHKLLVKAGIELSTDLKVSVIGGAIALTTNVEYTLYTDSGESTVSGFALKFSKSGVRVRFVIDGVVIFNIDSTILSSIANHASASLPAIYVSYNANQNVFFFTPAFPIKAFTSVGIYVTSTAANTNVVGQIIQVS